MRAASKSAASYNINISGGGYLNAQFVTAGTGAAYGSTSNIDVSSGTLNCTSYDYTVNAGTTLNLATSSGGLISANRWIVNNNILNANLSGGTIQSGSTFTNNTTTNLSFNGGGLFQVPIAVLNGGSQLNVSGAGTLTSTNPTNGQYMPSGGNAAVSVSGAYVALENGTISNVANAGLTANVSGGTLSIGSIGMNPNNLTTDYTTLTANVGGGGLFSVGSGGLYMNTGGSTGNGLIAISVSGGSTFGAGSGGIGSGVGGIINMNVNGGTIQTTGSLGLGGTCNTIFNGSGSVTASNATSATGACSTSAAPAH